MADGSDREVTQTDQNNINSQWSLFFTDLDELLSEYEQHRSTNDIAITENLTIHLENAVRALQSVSHFVSYTKASCRIVLAQHTGRFVPPMSPGKSLLNKPEFVTLPPMPLK